MPATVPASPTRAVAPLILHTADRPAAAAAWAELADHATGFASWTWTQTWLEHYGDVVEHRFVLARRGDQPVGVALLTAGSRSPLRPRTLHLGTAGEPHGSGVFVEHNHLVAAPDDRAAFASALAAATDADPGWDRLHLDGVAPADAAAWPAATVTIEECPVTDLRGEGGDVLDGLSGTRRRRARATLRAFGPLTLEWAPDGAAATAILDELIDLHQRHWTQRGEPGAFAQPRFTAFHRAYAPRAVAAGEAALVRVHRGDGDGETVACLYGLIDGDRLLFYQGGLRGYEDNRLRSGQAAHVLFMRACRDRGLAEYDFLAPASRYKLELSTHTVPLAWAEQERDRWRTRSARVVRRVRAGR